jgi:hypothetical protein
MVSLLALCAAASALLSCSNSTVPTAPAGHIAASTAAINKGLSICSWGLGDFTGGDSYLASRMNEDGTYEIDQYATDAASYITSNATTGLTTVHQDTLVVVKGNLPASEHSYSSGESTAITLALDLRLVVTPHQGTGLHPIQGGQGGNAYTRFMTLSGTINGVQIGSGSGLSDVMALGRYAHFLPPPRGATPFNWYGLNGAVQFCTH